MDIKRILKEKGVTLDDLCKEMTNKKGEKGVDKSNVSQIINGNPTIGKLREIAAIIGCNITDFFADETPAQPSASCPHCGKPIKVNVSMEAE